MAINKAKIFAVTSVKGGTGKTTMVLNLAGIFSLQKKKVLIVDLDLYGSAIAASLNLKYKHDLYTLADDLQNNKFDFIEKYVTKYNDFIDVLPAPKDLRNANHIDSKFLHIILSKASMKYDIMLIDTNHFLSEINLVTFDQCDEILYVITNDPIDLKNMKSMVAIYKNMKNKNYKIILNEAKDIQRNYFSNIDIKNIIKDNIDYTVPNHFYIKNIDKYVLDGEILTLNTKIRNSRKKGIKNLEMLANNLLKDKKD
ncbi:MAG: AAA family ATPase [Bacilli bacterium]|nr:AAA family ATPase [Bacilli bacterium]MDD4808479.1 AAA family ATPase [Bacilli bacterium]